MRERYMKLDKAPALRHPGSPVCDACEEETQGDDGSWLCPGCGTTWPIEILEDDGSGASLYEDWSGETLEGPVYPAESAWRYVHLPPDERDARLSRDTR